MTDNFGTPQDDAQGQNPQGNSASQQNPWQAGQQQRDRGQVPPLQYQQQSGQTPRQPYSDNRNPYIPGPQQPWAQQAGTSPTDTPQSYAQPDYTQAGYTQPGYAAQGSYVTPQGTLVQPYAPWNTMAIVGFVLSFLCFPAGLVISIIAIYQIRKTRERGNGLAIAGVIISGIYTAVVVLFAGLLIYAVNQELTDYESYSDPYCSSTSGYGCDDDSDTIDSALRSYFQNHDATSATVMTTAASAAITD
ncbi:DUF4190 domain-containing protein [Bifidobacterium crudilactis]|jgi:hypothetical protein|uniref:DUF4190 domain-containing protein n=1 Tax=Bifidobacterium crudilactis TaxID=327277 RepID=A0A971CYU3_9BIFI|nr:DUF4190 domain-containing protein [Bifidobacterium crudilactis]MCI1868293.1 DUF4190 domain-containing protein [Bifidobacterium crudilactis]MDN5972758.1 DUF4190 domain-containing protein [Bifidobacterium crudilactis]MDN6001021.1 DUF4190 domain-containing protein [Bifidobacterium crudilactis]MDN6208845.1 DUF4190 domain-containing protein [Bifidobacterium crudilactis]MDN6425511.1 DUF4190 domain-containing protein [Bifidobacterium crudilactis]